MENAKKPLIIIGAAPCCTDDLAAFHAMGYQLPAMSYMLIGLDSVEKIPWPAQYFATYHPSDIMPAIERRKAFGGNVDFEKIIAHQQHIGAGRDLVDLIIPCEPPTGSSALLGVLAGIRMGYKKIVVCGCPLIGVNDKNYDYANFQKGWTAKLPVIKNVTRSMSGWTMELLGAPTEEWMGKPPPAPA